MPEILAQDVLRPMLNPNANRSHVFDAIVCDPPYGIRHRSKKLEGENDFDVDAIYS